MQEVNTAVPSVLEPPATSERGLPSSESVETGDFDLTAYAQEHRYRVRNLHDGHPVPPARRRKGHDASTGYVGTDDRWDAIAGYDGYVTDEGAGQLGVCLFYRSARGVGRAEQRIRAMGGTVTQVGDTEIAGNIPVERIENALKLIRVSKIKPGNPNPKIPPAFYGPYASQDRLGRRVGTSGPRNPTVTPITPLGDVSRGSRRGGLSFPPPDYPRFATRARTHARGSLGSRNARNKPSGLPLRRVRQPATNRSMSDGI